MEADKKLHEILSVLKDISEKLEKISQSQTVMIECLDKSSQSTYEQTKRALPIDVDTLLNLPDHLRKSVQVLMDLKSATAEEVASQTHRTRAAESDYLNQLLKMGYVEKERKGRIVFFSVR